MRLLSCAVVVGGLLLSGVAYAQDEGGGEMLAGGGIVFGTETETVGVQGNFWMGLPQVKGLRLGGDVVVYLPFDRGSADIFWLSVNPGAQYVFDIPNVPVRPYAEAGLALAFVHASTPVGSDSDTKLGLNLGGGVEYDAGFARIYGMLRYQILGDDADQLELGGGLRWAL